MGKTIPNVTWFTDVNIYVCNDCGAFSEKEDEIKHYDGCKVGDSEKWSRYYENQPTQEKQDLEDKEYEKYLEDNYVTSMRVNMSFHKG